MRSRAARRLVPCALVATLGAAAVVVPAPAQVGAGKITGVVTDASTGQPLGGAQVYLEGTGIGTLTQENGRYFLINVPAGSYTLVAQLIGYATVRKENVLVAMEVTRTADFQLPPQAVALEEVVVEAERVPLIETKATGSADVVTAEVIRTLPVVDIPSVLALQHGFLQVPQNTDVVAYVDQRRGLSPVRIRGGRAGETLTLVDGIPINNFVLGGPAMFLGGSMVEQIDYIRGGFEPKYGNALSGVVNIKTREPSGRLEGQLQYQSSAFGGWLGNKYDELLDYNHLEGFVSGPVPGTSQKLRFVVGGRNWDQADMVRKFDDDVMNPLELTRNPQGHFGSLYDLRPGWQSFGFDNRRDIFAKLAYYFTPAMKLSVSAVDYTRQTRPFDPAWAQAHFDLFGQCVLLYPSLIDVCKRTYLDGVEPERMEDLRRTASENQYVLQASIRQDRTLYWANWDHTLGRVAYSAAVGQFEQSRNTCVFLSGICLGRRIASTWTNWTFQSSGGDKNYNKHPIFGSDDVFGGESLTSRFARFDLEWQATDHHNLAAGLFYQKHDVFFEEGRDVGLNDVQIEWNRYAGQPWDAAFYMQDEMEYDFLTLRLGFRLDYGRASGLFFADPRDPTNGTTAFDVCENPEAFGLPPDAFTIAQDGKIVKGVTACGLRPDLKEQATEVAARDDFKEAEVRRQFSPRIGVSFPVTASSSVFFNFGRFSQNPLIHNLYRMTAIGTPAEGTRNALSFVNNAIREPLLGNAHLLTEGTTSYEIGFLAEIGELYGLSAVVFSKDQLGLTGIREGGRRPDGSRVFDFGGTYGANTFNYAVLLNLDFQTARGFELSLRRRLQDYWAFDLRYSFAQIRTNAAPPDLELQKREEGDEQVRQEIRSEIDQPHVFNGVLRFQVGDEVPDIPFGEWLRNSNLSFIVRAASGMPYTPQLDPEGDELRVERNSGTGPWTMRVDALLSKEFRHANLRYGFFVRIDNLLNRDNCIQVYPSNGTCDLGALTEDREQTRTRGLGGLSPLFAVTQIFDRPYYKAPPRSVNAGIRIRF